MTTNLSGLVAANIRAELARRNIPQAAVADALGLSNAAVSRRLNGRAPIDIDDLENIAGLLDVAPVSLLAETA